MITEDQLSELEAVLTDQAHMIPSTLGTPLRILPGELAEPLLGLVRDHMEGAYVELPEEGLSCGHKLITDEVIEELVEITSNISDHDQMCSMIRLVLTVGEGD